MFLIISNKMLDGSSDTIHLQTVDVGGSQNTYEDIEVA